MHDVARIKTGRYAGGVGRVVEVLTSAGGVRVRVHLQGVIGGEVVDRVQSFAAGQVERNQ